MHSFLESKREDYPRFYYLSNEDLLEVLYERDAEKLAGILVKCFNSIFDLFKQLVLNILNCYLITDTRLYTFDIHFPHYAQ